MKLGMSKGEIVFTIAVWATAVTVVTTLRLHLLVALIFYFVVGFSTKNVYQELVLKFGKKDGKL